MTGADGLLIARLAAGDDEALAEAYDRFAAAVHRAAGGVVGPGAAAQDIVQDRRCDPGPFLGPVD